MKAKKTVLGLSLLCALVFSAFGAASAQAVTHTTQFTCAPKLQGFFDAHCDTVASGGQGTFGHSALPANTMTEEIASNLNTGTETSSWILNGKIAAVELELTCETISAMGSSENNTTSEDIKGTLELEFAGCKLLKPASQAAKCSVTVKTLKANLTSEGMGLKFSPTTGTVLTEIVIAKSGAEACALAGTYKLEGTMFAHGLEGESNGGATIKLTDSDTTKTLTLGGNVAGISGNLTTRMGSTVFPGNPITATTVG
jgi:hypothetical protein